MSLTTFRRIYDAHRGELDERGRLELDERVGRWAAELRALRNSWSGANLGDATFVARALGIDARAHTRGAAKRAPIFRPLGLRFGKVLRLFELAKRHAVHQKAPLFALVEERGGVEGRPSVAAEWDATRKQRAVMCDEPAAVSAGAVVEAALAEPSMREFRAWALGYLAMRGTCPGALGTCLGALGAQPSGAQPSGGGNGSNSSTVNVVSRSR